MIASKTPPGFETWASKILYKNSEIYSFKNSKWSTVLGLGANLNNSLKNKRFENRSLE